MRGSLAVLVLLGLLPGCTLRIGGPRPVDFTAVAVYGGPGAGADSVQAIVTRSGADVVFLLAPRDGGWFAAALPEGHHPATTSLHPVPAAAPAPHVAPAVAATDEPAPGDRAPVRGTIGIRAELLPDSTRRDRLPPLRPPPLPPTLRAEGVGRIRERGLHFMAAAFPAGDGEAVAAAARDILSHIATQVEGDAVVVVAVALDSGADGSVLDDLVGAYLRGAGDCAAPGEPLPGLRLYYAPVALVECLAAVPLADGSGILFRLRTRG